MSQPLVSALIPAYNAVDTLGRAIESVRAQTYPNIEIVVVDDGSTDDTWELLHEYDDVIAIRQPNGGLENARNRAAAESYGDVLALLDADDEWHPLKTEIQLSVLLGARNCRAVFTGRTFIRNSGQPHVYRRHASGCLLALSCEGVLFHRDRGVVLGPSAMFPRSTFEALGGFDERAGEEYDLFARMAAREGQVLWLGLPLYVQHKRTGSMSTMLPRKLNREHALLEAWDPAVAGDDRPLSDAVYRELCRKTFDRLTRRSVKAGDVGAARRCLAKTLQYGGPTAASRLAVTMPRLARQYERFALLAAELLGRGPYRQWRAKAQADTYAQHARDAIRETLHAMGMSAPNTPGLGAEGGC